MTVYTPTGPFTDGSPPGYSASFGNNVENALTAAGSIYFLTTPYHLYTNPTLNSGTTRTDACTGVGTPTIPSNAKAILLGIGIFAATAGGYVQIYPAGGTAGQYAGLTGPVANQYTVGGMVIMPLGTGGQITVKANGSNIVLQDWYIYGYVI